MSNANPEERPSSSSTQPPEFPQEMIKVCENLAAITFHNPKEAISQVNELCSKHDNIPLVHFTRGQVLKIYIAKLHESDKNKIKHLRDAINSLQRAVDMCPQSPFYSHALAEACFLLAQLNHADYHKVVQECERTLSMDAFSEIPRMDGKQRDNHEKLKMNIEKLILAAKAAKEKDDLDRIRKVGRDDRKNTKNKTKLDIRKNDRKLECRTDFVKKTGEYWRELSYDEKCTILDVKVKDVESFYGSWKNKNSQALTVLMEAVCMYREKSHWFTWTCCFCKEDMKKEDFDVWSSIEKHIDNHFDDPEPRLKGTFDYNSVGNFDSLDISDGVFVLHNVLDRKITKGMYNAPIPNNKFLSQWFTSEHDVKLQLELWKNRRDHTLESASMIYEQIVELKEDMKAILEKHEKEKQEAAKDLRTVVSAEITALEEKIVTLKREAVSLSSCDYREIIVPLLKYFVQVTLECDADKQARAEADAKMAELIKDETPKDKNVPTNSKIDKKKRHGKIEVKSEECSEYSANENNPEQEERELKEGLELDAGEESNQVECGQESKILIGSIPVTLKTPKSKEIAHEAEEIARKAMEHPPENVDDANEGWIAVTQKKKKKDVAKGEQ